MKRSDSFEVSNGRRRIKTGTVGDEPVIGAGRKLELEGRKLVVAIAESVAAGVTVVTVSDEDGVAAETLAEEVDGDKELARLEGLAVGDAILAGSDGGALRSKFIAHSPDA
ncbi:hypothetical protein FBEOM_12524 [Fusarium beomiforme]|uniref:Uncharacterized protein n=1 Tax=Fusarium beomiforme TaxID=44412 RepID=A0A9P5A7I0_9HYPO|nr:hypothetical protein FBEOM_12524 [Fusarium beomiforme]